MNTIDLMYILLMGFLLQTLIYFSFFIEKFKYLELILFFLSIIIAFILVNLTENIEFYNNENRRYLYERAK